MRDASVLVKSHRVLFVLTVLCFLAFATIAVALRLASSTHFRSAIIALAASEGAFLVIGAALICGCFLIGQNDYYRGIDLLFVLPGLLALSATPQSHRLRAVFRGTAIVVVFVIWGPMVQQVVAALSGGSRDPIGESAAAYVYWIIRELAWWWIVSVLLAVLFCFVAQSRVWRAFISAASEGGTEDNGRNVINPSLASRA
jgi:hypothetical protein